jgi:hypothetical protein
MITFGYALPLNTPILMGLAEHALRIEDADIWVEPVPQVLTFTDMPEEVIAVNE